MKKTLTILALLVLSSPTATQSQSLRPGLKAGVSRASWTGEFGTGNNPFDSRTGLMAGATLSYQLVDVVGIQLEALYVQKGASSDYDFTANVGYLELPMLVTLALPLGRVPIRPIAIAGVAPALEISCSVIARGGGIPEAPLPPPTRMDCIGWRNQRLDIGVIVGGGVETLSGPIRMTAEFRRTSGQRNIIEGYEPLRTFNSTWSVMIGAALAIPK